MMDILWAFCAFWGMPYLVYLMRKADIFAPIRGRLFNVQRMGIGDWFMRLLNCQFCSSFWAALTIACILYGALWGYNDYVKMGSGGILLILALAREGSREELG